MFSSGRCSSGCASDRAHAAVDHEFGGRHELYEINYLGSNDLTRLQNYWEAQAGGEMNRMKGMVEACMAEYDLDGWTVPDLINNDDVSVLRR